MKILILFLLSFSLAAQTEFIAFQALEKSDSGWTSQMAYRECDDLVTFYGLNIEVVGDLDGALYEVDINSIAKEKLENGYWCIYGVKEHGIKFTAEVTLFDKPRGIQVGELSIRYKDFSMNYKLSKK